MRGPAAAKGLNQKVILADVAGFAGLFVLVAVGFGVGTIW